MITKRFFYNLARLWFEADGFGNAAAIAFHALFAIAPLFAFTVSLATYFLSGQQIEENSVRWLESLVSHEQAEALVNILQIEKWSNLNWIYTGLTGLTFLWAASLAFVRLRVSVNILMGYESRSIRHAITNSVRGRLIAILFTIAFGLILALGLVATATVPQLINSLWDFHVVPEIGIRILTVGFLAAGVVAIFRYMPTEAPCWRSILPAAALVVASLEIGRLLFGRFVGGSEIPSAYGASNTLVIFLILIFFSAQALLLGFALATTIDRHLNERGERFGGKK